MALLWQKRANGALYQVRTAGSSLRLYTDGVLHSQYNPHSPVTGGVWDLLTLAGFLRPEPPQRVLVLGVGGGAVIRQLRHFLSPAHIVGVDCDRVHLHVARRFFGVGGAGVRLQRAEAGAWLAGYCGPPFDLIVDDLFGHHQGEPVRALPADSRWFAALLRHLSPAGVLALNFVSRGELARCGYFSNGRLRARFAAAFELYTPVEENAVGVFLCQDSTTRLLRERLKAVPALDPRRARSKLRYRIRRLT